MNEVIIRLADGLDPRIKGFVKEDSNGDYNVYINSCLCAEAQKQTCEHELQHIYLKHLQSDRPVMELEEEAKGDSYEKV